MKILYGCAVYLIVSLPLVWLALGGGAAKLADAHRWLVGFLELFWPGDFHNAEQTRMIALLFFLAATAIFVLWLLAQWLVSPP